MLIGIPVKDISYNLNGYAFPLNFGWWGWGGGQISSSYNDTTTTTEVPYPAGRGQPWNARDFYPSSLFSIQPLNDFFP